MPYTNRHLFRMTDYRNIQRFLQDGALYAKNYREQSQYSVSHSSINNRRGDVYKTPNGNDLHDYVPFYFSPITSMAWAIHKGNVVSVSPYAEPNSQACIDDIVYMVSNVVGIVQTDVEFWFSDMACNTAYFQLQNDLNVFDTHIRWPLFDQPQYGVNDIVAKIPEIGYNGVCKWCNHQDSPLQYNDRNKLRMAEFMIKDRVALNLIQCIVTKSEEKKIIIEAWMRASGWDIPVFAKRECYPR